MPPKAAIVSLAVGTVLLGACEIHTSGGPQVAYGYGSGYGRYEDYGYGRRSPYGSPFMGGFGGGFGGGGYDRGAYDRKTGRPWWQGNGRCDDARYKTSNGGSAPSGSDEYDCRKQGLGDGKRPPYPARMLRRWF
ncbi:MAG TPA: hypothetical protein VEY95_03700 [Azospirillaceae bacterium]|nr:hypothetical protein [Azospirillaceae bacterium]